MANLLTLVIEGTETISAANGYNVALYTPTGTLITESYDNPSFMNIVDTGTWYTPFEMQAYTVAVAKLHHPAFSDAVTGMEDKFFATDDIKTHIADVTVAKTYHHTMAEIQTFLEGVMGDVPTPANISVIDSFVKLIDAIDVNAGAIDAIDLSAYSTTTEMEDAIDVVDAKVGDAIAAGNIVVEGTTHQVSIMALDAAIKSILDSTGGSEGVAGLSTIYANSRHQEVTSGNDYYSFNATDDWIPIYKDIRFAKVKVYVDAYVESIGGSSPGFLSLEAGVLNTAGDALTTSSVFTEMQYVTNESSYDTYVLEGNISSLTSGMNVLGLKITCDSSGNDIHVRNVTVIME